ncbi:hypothetical protein [Ramlibacter albus]|nr:hypothetical protein [Ramlibacter albus]
MRDVRLIWFKDDPEWATLRGDARFAALLRRMNMHAYPAGMAGV